MRSNGARPGAFARTADPLGQRYHPQYRLDRSRAPKNHVYKRAGLPEIIDLQPNGKDAKIYQVRQVIDLIGKYDLRVE